MTTPGNVAWDLNRVKQIVTQNELERGRIEYKRDLSSVEKVLAAISALANTFGGVVLVGVDEDQKGLDRLTGVPVGDRARLVSFCWDQLTPPFNPQIEPIPLGRDDLYILAVIIEPDYIRRPVMLNKGNKIYVRLEEQNRAPDWYRLRDLYAEHVDTADYLRLPDPGISLQPGQALTLRARLLLAGPRARPARITGSARQEALASLQQSPLTTTGSAVIKHSRDATGEHFSDTNWQLHGTADLQQFGARWHASGPENAPLAEARIHVQATPQPGRGDALLITLDTRVHAPRPPASSPDRDPFINTGVLHKLILDITSTLWGPSGETISTGVLGQPLGPPALLDLTITTTLAGSSDGTQPSLNEYIDFGTAQLIPGNTPGAMTHLSPVQPDREQLGSPAALAPLSHNWLIELGTANGYQWVEDEVSRWTGISAFL